MNAQEKSLIDSVFDRLAQSGGAAKDADALAYIRERAARVPDAVYGLVQAVLIQEMTINQAAAHVAELERQVAQANQAAPAQGASFLGGAGPWGQVRPAAAPQPAPLPQAAPQPQYQPQPQPQPGPWGAPAGGGFLRNVASMAAGVAGGTLLADGIASLFGGRHLFGGGFGGIGGYGPFGGGFGGQPGMVENVENVTVNNYGDSNGGNFGRDDGLQGNAADYQDASYPDASDDGSSFDGGGDFGGSDFSDT